MVDKAKMKRVMPKKIIHKVAPLGKMGGEALIFPNNSSVAHHSRSHLEDYKVDNLESETGTIQHTPSEEKDIVNKEYVDSVASRDVVDLFLTNNASDIGGYKDLEIDVVTDAKETITQAIPTGTTLIASFVSILNEEEINNIEILESGVYAIHIHAETNFNQGMSFFWEFYHRTAGGTETLLGTSHESPILTSVETEYDVHISITTETTFISGDRIVAKVVGRNTGAATKNISISMEGDTATRIEFPGFVSPTFVPDHAVEHEVGGSDLVDHDNLTNFASNEHINWTNATSNLITTGTITARGTTNNESSINGTGTEGGVLNLNRDETISDNEKLGTLNFSGDDPNTLDVGARIFAKATENWETNKQGSNLVLATTATGTTGLSELIILRGDSSDVFIGSDLFVNSAINAGNGDLTLDSGSITDSSGAISFGNENLSTTGTLAAGVTSMIGTSSSLVGGDTTNFLIQDSSADGIAGLRIKNDIQEWKIRTSSDDTFQLVDTTHSGKRPFYVVSDSADISLRIDSNGVIINELSTSTVDFRVESNNRTNMLFVDASTNRVGIATSVLQATLTVDQLATTGAIPTLTLDQADVSEGFVNFIGSDRGGVLTGAPVGSTTSAASIRVEVNGTKYLIPLFPDA